MYIMAMALKIWWAIMPISFFAQPFSIRSIQVSMERTYLAGRSISHYQRAVMERNLNV